MKLEIASNPVFESDSSNTLLSALLFFYELFDNFVSIETA